MTDEELAAALRDLQERNYRRDSRGRGSSLRELEAYASDPSFSVRRAEEARAAAESMPFFDPGPIPHTGYRGQIDRAFAVGPRPVAAPMSGEELLQFYGGLGLEMTGLPSVRRGVHGIGTGIVGGRAAPAIEGLGELALGAAGAVPFAAPGARALQRANRFRVKDVGGIKTVTPRKAKPRTIPAARDTQTIDDLRAILAQEGMNQPLELAREHALRTTGKEYALTPNLKASLEKQSGIARVFAEAAKGSPEYKRAVFDQYKKQMPDVVKASGATDYDSLVASAYRSLGKETYRQFRDLPITTKYHSGELEYAKPSDMMRDVVAEGKMNVFRGGDPHPYLKDVDPVTGLNTNEMFRAVHDYYGHIPGGATFRPTGEEMAYASHAQTMEPLARMALLAETRGQNSFVNYSPLNADLVTGMEKAKAALSEIAAAERVLEDAPAYSYLRPRAQTSLEALGDPEVYKQQLRDLGRQWRYAPQAPVMLPPEYLAVDTAGGVPDYMRALISPEAGTSVAERGVHFSRNPGLLETDPRFYGTAHRGAEFGEVSRGVNAAPKRTYFYAGDKGTVTPEAFIAEGRTPYEAELTDVYDPVSDPAGIAALARAWSAEGSADRQLERLAREYGYAGLKGRLPEGPVVQMFTPQKVKPIAKESGRAGYAEGGAVRDAYDTRLTDEEERAFSAWKQKLAPKDSGADYDLRGAFKAGVTPDPVTRHWPDTFKKPNHPTFSVESRYARPPRAAASRAGRWGGDRYVPARGSK